MAFEDLRVQIAMMLEQIAESPGDRHQLQEALREKLSEMRAMSLPLPEDLVVLEQYLEDDLEEGVEPAPDEDGPPEAA